MAAPSPRRRNESPRIAGRSSSSRPPLPASPICCCSPRRQPRTRFARKHQQAARVLLGRGKPFRELSGAIDQAAREYRDICAAIDAIGHLGLRGQDALVARGERVSAQLLTAAVRRLKRRVSCIDAVEVIETDGEHGSATPKLDETAAQARAVVAPLLKAGTIVIVPGFIGRAPDGSVATLGRGGIGSHRDGPGAIAWRPARRAVEGRARHPDRRSADRSRCAADSAAASSRGRRGRALRRQGPPSARVDPGRRHANRAARSIVPGPHPARHRSLRATIAEGLPGQGDRDVAGPGDRDGRRQGHGRRARHRRAHVHRGRCRRTVGLDDLPGVVRELDRLHGAGVARRAGGAAPAADLPSRDRAGPDRRRQRARQHDGDCRRRRRHGRHARHLGARVRGARKRRHQRRGDRARIVRTQHFVRRGRRRCRRGGAPGACGLSAVEDWRRAAADPAAHRRGAARIRARRPRARRSDRHQPQPRRPHRRTARSIRATSSMRAASAGAGCSTWRRRKIAGGCWPRSAASRPRRRTRCR